MASISDSSSSLPEFINVNYDNRTPSISRNRQSGRVEVSHTHMGYIEYKKKQSGLSIEQLFNIYLRTQADLKKFEAEANLSGADFHGEPSFEKYRYGCTCGIEEDRLLLEELKSRLK